ncbi:hypothetical protein ACSS6W_002077 [Trichoderma asperelloides]
MLITIFMLHNRNRDFLWSLLTPLFYSCFYFRFHLLFFFPNRPLSFPLGSTTVDQFYVSLYRCFTHRLMVDVKKRANR